VKISEKIMVTGGAGFVGYIGKNHVKNGDYDYIILAVRHKQFDNIKKVIDYYI